MHKLGALAAAVLVVGSVGCEGGAGEASREGRSAEDLSTTYDDIRNSSSIDQGAWYDAINGLNAQFIASCPSEQCTSAFPSYTPLTFGCSITTKANDIHACAWTFGVSQVGVDPKTAAIDTNLPTFVCPIKIKSDTTAASLLAFLQGAGSLHAALPGEASIDQQLAGCFANPIGATPYTLGSGSTYVAASDYYATAANQAKWTEVQTNLLDGFNGVCGDTFCGSDYGDLQSLAFECSVTKSSGNLKGCVWAFAGSYYQVSTSGAVTETTKSFRCPVAVTGTLSNLITTLTAAGTTDPIRRTLPGETTSAYDAIASCLP